MPYCKVQKKEVNSCDHYKCNEGKSEKNDPRSGQGMNYCHKYKKWVYSCDHAACN